MDRANDLRFGKGRNPRKGKESDSFWPNFCLQTNFGPVFCIIPVSYRAATLISSIFRHFRQELRKKSFRTYIGGEKRPF